jgi:hypothetical protein
MIDMGDDGKIAYLLHFTKRAQFEVPFAIA